MTDILQVSPTRSELLDMKKRIALAKKGHSLLKRKQDVMIREFFDRIKEYKKFKQNILEQTKGAYDALSLDIALSGVSSSKSAAYAAPQYFDIKHSTKHFMGLSLPQIEAKRNEEVASNTIDTSAQLEEVREKFHGLFEKLLVLASMELAIKALAEEIKKVKRRVNSLEHIQIPRLENTAKYIRFVLGEQERENFTRLKIIKEQLSA